MRRIVFAIAALLIVFGLVVFLEDISKALFTVRVGEATGRDVQLSLEGIGSSKGLSGTGQGRKAIQPGFVDQGRIWVPGSEQWRKPIDPVPAKGHAPSRSIDMLSAARTRQMLSAYTRSLQVRATQAGIPRHQAARLSVQVAKVAWKAQLAGLPSGEAIGMARLFGEKALSSAVKEQRELSVLARTRTAMVGGKAQQGGTPRAPSVRISQVLRQQQRQETRLRMLHEQDQ